MISARVVPPAIVSAIFSSDGSYISVLFDSSTDRGGTVSLSNIYCSSLLSFRGAEFVKCHWKADNEVLIYPGGVATSLLRK